VTKKRLCNSVAEVVDAVRDVATRNRSFIDVLDVVAHSEGMGVQLVGGEVLFSYDGTGRLIARALRPFLTTNARVRLFGCYTAESDGRALLSMLRQAFGGSVVVYGTIQGVADNLFLPTGFDQAYDNQLFSSTEAETTLAPDLLTQGLVEQAFWDGIAVKG
jgi:hypothetical protein